MFFVRFKDMKHLKVILALLIVVLGINTAYSQDSKNFHPILDNFGITLDNNRIIIHWTIKAGRSCNGTGIYRSDDDINWMLIGSIDGICGNNDEPISYVFVDESPVFGAWNYYRLELGLEGFTGSVSIYLHLNEDKLIIKGDNPWSGNLQILINDDSSRWYKLVIQDLNGRTIQDLKTYSKNVVLPEMLLAHGLYLISLYDSYNSLLQTKKLIFSY